MIKDKQQKKLVVVESPAKADTIEKILGGDYEVEACMGHVRDLPENDFGINVEEGFEPEYQIMDDKRDVVDRLKEKTSGREVYLASDPDREGEAISWHLIKALDLNEREQENGVYRVVFHEITSDAVQEAFENPGDISESLVNAQKARRLLDRIVGYRLSPLLWKKVSRGLSAGRVQSVAVMLVVERDREREAFDPEEYWKIDARLHETTEKTEQYKDDEDAGFEADLFRVDGEKPSLSDEEEATEVVESVEDEPFIVSEIQRKQRKTHPDSPFHTSLLQQRASSKLRFSTKKTMFIAQELYEGIDIGEEGPTGLITYMRTDSFRISEGALEECRQHITDRFGEDHLSSEIRRFDSDEGSQEAHEAIRPTSADRTPESIKEHLTEDQFRLYQLIWRRFIASQMAPAVYNNTRVDIEAGDAIFRAHGRELVFPGYLDVFDDDSRRDKQVLPELVEQQEVGVIEINANQHFTKPPPRYSEASLVKTLEDKGIGRPSTYAPIISTIQDRGYVEKDGRSLESTELGQLVTDKLRDHFSQLMDTEFTSKIEKQLDRIEQAETDWRQVLKKFYDQFQGDLELAEDNMVTEKEKEPDEEVFCEECGEPMVIRWTKDGKFLGCSNFPECKYTESMEDDETLNEDCPECDEELIVTGGRSGPFIGCSAYPDCDYARPLDYIQDESGQWLKLDLPCSECGEKMVIRSGRDGNRFLGCSAFPDCDNTENYPGDRKIDSWKQEGILHESAETPADV